MDINKKIGANIKKIRKLRNKTLIDIENDTGISNGSLSNIENGKRNPSMEMLNKIAKALKVDLIDLTGISEIEKIAEKFFKDIKIDPLTFSKGLVKLTDIDNSITTLINFSANNYGITLTNNQIENIKNKIADLIDDELEKLNKSKHK